MVQILDTTLRDGSYVVDFQFTARDTALIATFLDQNNLHYIEVGHGLGLNASSKESMRAACSDEEYLQAAAAAIQKAKWGMFFIPGIGRLEDMDLAARHGMKFIRVGTNVTEANQAEAYIGHAKKLGLEVSANFMKTYALPPDKVGEAAALVTSFGADLVCVVDSAGGMLPDDVEAYITAIRAKTRVRIGFHGHNNLGLAIGNSLRAIECGADVVDVSIRGLGRSAGNASAEMLLLALKRKGVDLGIDPIRLMDLAEEKIDPILRNYAQVDSLGIISGYAQFHSSFLDKVLRYAHQYHVDPRRLIVALCEVDRVNAPDAIVEGLARELAQGLSSPRQINVQICWKKSPGQSPDLREKALAVGREIRVRAKKSGKKSVFNIVQAEQPGKPFVSEAIYEGPQFVFGSTTISDAASAGEIASVLDGIVDIIFLDADEKQAASAAIRQEVAGQTTRSKLLKYSDWEIWSKSVGALLLARLRGANRPSVLVVGEGPLADQCRAALRPAGEFRLLPSAGATGPVDCLVCCGPVADAQVLATLAPTALVVDAMLGALTPAMIATLHQRHIPIIRSDMRVVIHNEIANACGMDELVNTIQGTANLDGVAIAAGGVVAPRGTVIVDNISAPRHVFGIANGNGFLAADPSPEELDCLSRVERKLV